MQTPIDIESKLPLWVAFSELFLDTEITETEHRYIARVIAESSFSPEEVVHILWLEVFPALCDNLRSVAGEWAGFDEQWLVDRITGVINGTAWRYGFGGIIFVNQVITITEEEWQNCCRYLPDAFAKQPRPSKWAIKRQPLKFRFIQSLWSRLLKKFTK